MCPFFKSPACRTQRKWWFTKRSTRALRIQRYRCLTCRRSFSDQTSRLTFRQKLPHFTQPVFRILTAGVSQRKCAEFLGIHRDTVAKRMVKLAEFAAQQRSEAEVQAFERAHTVVFDEMETFEHTKMKPLSIVVAVDEATRLILSTKVAVMPAKGLLAARSRKKYGRRRDDRAQAIREVLKEVPRRMPRALVVKSDQCPRYPTLIKEILPGLTHLPSKGRRSCVVGQGAHNSRILEPRRRRVIMSGPLE